MSKSDQARSRSGSRSGSSRGVAWVALLGAALACGADAERDGMPGAPAPSEDGGGSRGEAGRESSAAAPTPAPWALGPKLGARRLEDGALEVRVRAPSATRVEVALFREAFGEPEVLRVPLVRTAGTFTGVVPAAALTERGLVGTLYYGLRAWGPNWPYDPAWTPGSLAGFVTDVDASGNRMNPNKLLLDPYALEASHDPYNLRHGDGAIYQSGEGTRERDSARVAPKGVVLPVTFAPPRDAPPRALKDDVVYEVHLRGLTKSDPAVPEDERGTYAGAARRARYLHELGVTVVELLPLHETPNDHNDRTPEADGDNYWGYSTSSYFAPDRRYAKDKGPGGPTRELRAMVDAFHAEGIKVWVDVVYNHTAEGGAFAEQGARAPILSWRGLDNATYYELADDPRFYVDGNGVGPNVNVANHVTGDLVMDSLRYWHEVLGLDGFRFDLAPLVANGCTRGCYRFDRDGLVKRIASELPARPWAGGAGADLVAEPWALAPGSYQLGAFPPGWAEWNDRYRDVVRKDLNRLGLHGTTRRDLARRARGSADLFAGSGRPPGASVNFVVAHDGMTLADVFAYDTKQNGQPWPFGPSNGGTDDDLAWSHGGEPARQRAAARAAFALKVASAGVPMFNGGDERLRTQRGNNNAYNLDSVGNWLDWSPRPEADAFAAFASRALGFRKAHAALRPGTFWREAGGPEPAQVVWLRDDGQPADAAYLDATDRHFLGWQLDGASLGDVSRAVLVAYNGWHSAVPFALPAPPPGTRWALALDTSVGAEAWGNAVPLDTPRAVPPGPYAVDRRTVAIFVAR